MIFGDDAETAREMEIDRQYAAGQQARDYEMPCVPRMGMMSMALRYAWIAGWNDRDIELGNHILGNAA